MLSTALIKTTLITFIFGITLGGGATFLFLKAKINSLNPSLTSSKEVHLGKKDFVNPLVDCNQWSESLPPKANVIKQQLLDYIKTSKQKDNTEQISVFYRDLLNGPQIEIDADQRFAAASLLKVPILIHYMKLAEKNPELLNQTLEFDLANSVVKNAVQTMTTPPPLNSGQKYAVDELLGRMITYSDNYATELLLKNQPQLNIGQLLMDMGIYLETVDNDYWISVRSYSSIFRILYNVTYLNEIMSNSSLQLLSLSKFNLGLREGVPKNVVVASKFGERQADDKFQLHDCGIIYHPERPYLLCIMTKGKDALKLSDSIRELSKIVWSAVDTKNL